MSSEVGVTLEVRRGSPDTVRLGALVAGLRQNNGMSRAEVATAAGVSEAYVGMVERGDRAPSLDKCRSVLRAVHARLATEVHPEQSMADLFVPDPETEAVVQLRFPLSSAAMEREMSRFLANVKSDNARRGRGFSLNPQELPWDPPPVRAGEQVRLDSPELADDAIDDLAESWQQREMIGDLMLRATRMDTAQMALLLRAAVLIDKDPGDARSRLSSPVGT